MFSQIFLNNIFAEYRILSSLIVFSLVIFKLLLHCVLAYTASTEDSDILLYLFLCKYGACFLWLLLKYSLYDWF